MFFEKKEELIYVKLSDKAIDFIKNVVVPELNISTPIGVSEICDIEDWVYALENTQYDDDGNEVDLDASAKAKLSAAQNLLAELMAIWGKANSSEDLDDLNKRLGLSHS